METHPSQPNDSIQQLRQRIEQIFSHHKTNAPRTPTGQPLRFKAHITAPQHILDALLAHQRTPTPSAQRTLTVGTHKVSYAPNTTEDTLELHIQGAYPRRIVIAPTDLTKAQRRLYETLRNYGHSPQDAHQTAKLI